MRPLTRLGATPFILLLLLTTAGCSSATSRVGDAASPQRFIYDRMVTTGIQERVFDLSRARWVTIKLSPSSNRQAVDDLEKLDLQQLTAPGSPPDLFPLVVEGTLLPQVHWTADPTNPDPRLPTPEPYQELLLERWWIGMPLVSHESTGPDYEGPPPQKVIRSLSEIGLDELVGYERRSE